jgi:hypothetical protein
VVGPQGRDGLQAAAAIKKNATRVFIGFVPGILIRLRPSVSQLSGRAGNANVVLRLTTEIGGTSGFNEFLCYIGRMRTLLISLTAFSSSFAFAKAPSTAPLFNQLTRTEFNFRAQERFVPLFWRADVNNDKTLDPSELVVLYGPWKVTSADFIDKKGFTKKFASTFESLVKPLDESKLSAEQKARRDILKKELEQGRPTLVENDFSASTKEDKAVLAHLKTAAAGIEKLYAFQSGTTSVLAKIAKDDVTSQAVFHRNQGANCVAPKTEKEANCSALEKKEKELSGLYPNDVQKDEKFCAKLELEKNKDELMGHFSAVVADGTGFKVVPYTQHWKSEMEAVARALDAAAAAVVSPDEKAFKAYLIAAAASFRSNDWEPANEAWVAMNAMNSKWYLRVAPDETYHEPCAWKAGFALQLARINKDSLVWQEKLEPVKLDMEKALAALAGAPYKARDVKFHLPDFIDVVLNAADQRNPHGATIGQSLPNWGPTSEKGGRTVVMTNLYTDVDSKESLTNQMSSLFCAQTMKSATAEPKPGVMSVILHEAAHNLGPAHDYQVNGKKDDQVFGGPLASTMEELKAQTSALYFSWWLESKGIISKVDATQATVRDVAWAFGHISRGMYDAQGSSRAYSQLASIQLGSAFKAGALVFKKDEKAANGTDVGCYEIDFTKWTPMVNELAKRVLSAKGSGNKIDAEKMKADFVDAKDAWAAARESMAERWLRAPKATFVYSIKQ